MEQLAKAASASNQQISHLENGRRRLSLDWMEKLGKALKCNPLALIDDPSIALDAEEANALSVFRKLTDIQKEAFVAAALAIADPETIIGKRSSV